MHRLTFIPFGYISLYYIYLYLSNANRYTTCIPIQRSRSPLIDQIGMQVMEIIIVFLIVTASVLGFLCLLVLEYQNSRAKKWHSIQNTHQMTLPTKIPQPESTPLEQPKPPEPARVA